MGKWLGWMGSMACAMLLMGAECNPTEAPCGMDANGDGVLDCEEGQNAACLNMCITLGQEDDPCVYDPCDAGSAGTVCATGLICVPGLSGQTCQPATRLFAQGCDPHDLLGSYFACSSGTYCARFEGTDDCNDWNITRPPWLKDSPLQGMCVLPAQEGEPCDSTWNQLKEHEHCQPCAPGLECSPAPWNGDLQVCRRACTDDAECPCAVQPGGCGEDHRCRHCIANQRLCEQVDGPDCCDPKSECLPVDVVEDGQASYTRELCCHALGQQCDGDGQCCPNARCNGGQCQACGSFPGAPPGEAGCCPGLVEHVPMGGSPVCGRACPQADAHHVCREQGGACDGPQLYLCDNVLGDYCPDEGEPMEGRNCIEPYLTAQCEREVTGHMTCGANGLECYVDPSDVCYGPDNASHCGERAYATLADAPPGEHCSGQDGEPDDTKCPPHSYCAHAPDGSPVHTACVFCEYQTYLTCWSPEEHGGC